MDPALNAFAGAAAMPETVILAEAMLALAARDAVAARCSQTSPCWRRRLITVSPRCLDIVGYLRCSAPGFVYSVGLSPPRAAASLATLEVMRVEPERVVGLNANGRAFLSAAKSADLNTGTSIGSAIALVIVGSSIGASRAAKRLFRHGVNEQPILYPADPERPARLRFFLSSEHTPGQIERAVNETDTAVRQGRAEKVPLAGLALALGARGG
jgi:8-amino-7-oxononanoate synthase